MSAKSLIKVLKICSAPEPPGFGAEQKQPLHIPLFGERGVIGQLPFTEYTVTAIAAERGRKPMVILTKLNNQRIVINEDQVECIDLIPESKVIMMNGRFHVVKETPEEIIQKTIEYKGAISGIRTNKVSIEA